MTATRPNLFAAVSSEREKFNAAHLTLLIESHKRQGEIERIEERIAEREKENDDDKKLIEKLTRAQDDLSAAINSGVEHGDFAVPKGWNKWGDKA